MGFESTNRGNHGTPKPSQKLRAGLMSSILLGEALTNTLISACQFFFRIAKPHRDRAAANMSAGQMVSETLAY